MIEEIHRLLKEALRAEISGSQRGQWVQYDLAGLAAWMRTRVEHEIKEFAMDARAADLLESLGEPAYNPDDDSAEMMRVGLMHREAEKHGDLAHDATLGMFEAYKLIRHGTIRD